MQYVKESRLTHGVKACILQIVPLEGHMKQWTAAGLAAHVREQGRHMTDGYVRRLCRRGRIQAMKLGRDWIIEDDEARRWLEKWLAK